MFASLIIAAVVAAIVAGILGLSAPAALGLFAAAFAVQVVLGLYFDWWRAS